MWFPEVSNGSINLKPVAATDSGSRDSEGQEASSWICRINSLVRKQTNIKPHSWVWKSIVLHFMGFLVLLVGVWEGPDRVEPERIRKQLKQELYRNWAIYLNSFYYLIIQKILQGILFI